LEGEMPFADKWNGFKKNAEAVHFDKYVTKDI
jgi:hypothetical protein